MFNNSDDGLYPFDFNADDLDSIDFEKLDEYLDRYEDSGNTSTSSDSDFYH